MSTPPSPEDVRHLDLLKREWGFGDFLLGHLVLNNCRGDGEDVVDDDDDDDDYLIIWKLKRLP